MCTVYLCWMCTADMWAWQLFRVPAVRGGVDRVLLYVILYHMRVDKR
jgi:hypothetical protein